MSHWNYRVIEFPDPGYGPFRAIHEVYYDDAGQPNGYTENAASIGWAVDEGDEAPAAILNRMREALDKPVLRPEDFERPTAAPAGGLAEQAKADRPVQPLAPPPGFDTWLDYVVATSSAAREANQDSLFDSSIWGKDVTGDEIRAAIAAELKALRAAAAQKPRYTCAELVAQCDPSAPMPADLQAWDSISSDKSAVSQNHNDIASAGRAECTLQLRGRPWRSIGSDTAIDIPGGNIVFADFGVDAGTRFGASMTSSAPIVLAEVISAETLFLPLQRKVDAYKSIASLQTILLVEEGLPRVHVYRRAPGTWTKQLIEGLDGEVRLEDLGLTLPLATLYERCESDNA